MINRTFEQVAHSKDVSRKARELIEQYRRLEAIDLLEEVLETDPTDAHSHTMLGTTYWKLAEEIKANAGYDTPQSSDYRDKSIEHLCEGSDLTPYIYRPAFAAALRLRQTAQYERAYEYLTRSIEGAPYDTFSWSEMALVLSRLNYPLAAVSCLQNAYLTNPEDAVVLKVMEEINLQSDYRENLDRTVLLLPIKSAASPKVKNEDSCVPRLVMA